MKIAIQGEPGSNSHAAVLQGLRGIETTLVPCAASAQVFERLANGTVDAAMLPIENSLYGSVFEHYDLLLRHPVRVAGETLLRVRHNLIAAPGVRLAEVRRVLSHPVALSQCRDWLRAHPAIEAVPAYDTAGSVKQLMEGGWRDAAAIAPVLAATEYGAEVLERGLEDHEENYTRFLLLRAADAGDGLAPAGSNKASLAFGLEHRPGALLRVLEVFAGAGLNLTRIESRPVPGRPWEYVFFADVRYDNGQLDAALRELGEVCSMVRELGRYRAAE